MSTRENMQFTLIRATKMRRITNTCVWGCSNSCWWETTKHMAGITIVRVWSRWYDDVDLTPSKSARIYNYIYILVFMALVPVFTFVYNFLFATMKARNNQLISINNFLEQMSEKENLKTYDILFSIFLACH